MTISREAQAARAVAFRARHRQKPLLVLPNAWDGASARLFAEAGFDAIATTSGGVAWALGYGDGERAPWDEICAATARIVRAAPAAAVTADIEAGWAETRSALAEHIDAIIRTGVVGLNLEDKPPTASALLAVDEAAARIRTTRDAADRAGVPIVVNARVDLFLARRGEDLSVFDEAVARGRAYIEAGADCVYPIGLTALDPVRRFVEAVKAPVNVMVRPGGPSLAALEDAHVARVSTATSLALAAFDKVTQLAAALKAGDLDALRAELTYPALQKLFG